MVEQQSECPSEELMNDFLESRGHAVRDQDWDESYNKKQCPVCGGVHPTTAMSCDSCGWEPSRTEK